MKTLRATLSTVLSLLVVFPIAYSISASFFQYTDFTALPPRLLPSSLNISNYIRAFSESSLARFLFNSLLTSIVGTLLRMTISIMAAYTFSFFAFKGRNALFILIVATMLLPSDALIIANFMTIRALRLTDTYMGIIAASLLAPTHIFMLRQYFRMMSVEYREAFIIARCTD